MTENTPTVIIDTRSSYRVGSPILKVQPVETIENLSFPQWHQPGFRTEIDRILHTEGVAVKDIDVVRRFHQGEDAKAVPRTILVVSDISTAGAYENWQRATTCLRRFLDTNNRSDIVIEIIDRNAAYGFSAQPITDCDAGFIEASEEFIAVLMDEIQDQQWWTVDVVQMSLGQESPRSVPTICLTADDAERDAWWERILPRMRKLAPMGMQIDLFYGTGAFYNTGRAEVASDPELFITMDAYDDVVDMGASIGVDDVYSGTVSISVELITGRGEKIECALTNHHVIATGPQVEDECPVGQFLAPSHRLCVDVCSWWEGGHVRGTYVGEKPD